MFVSYIHVLSAAYLMGLAAAAPMGPVNMPAIRRGVIGGWRHTLACGIGSDFEQSPIKGAVICPKRHISKGGDPYLRALLVPVTALIACPNFHPRDGTGGRQTGGSTD